MYILFYLVEIRFAGSRDIDCHNASHQMGSFNNLSHCFLKLILFGIPVTNQLQILLFLNSK